MKAFFALVIGLVALLVGGPGIATVAVLLSPLLSAAVWLLLPIRELEPEPIDVSPVEHSRGRYPDLGGGAAAVRHGGIRR
jgi:hypothetical protein